MIDSHLWLIALGPAALAALGCVPTSIASASARSFSRSAFAVSLFALSIACGVVIALCAWGPLRSGTIGSGAVGFCVYVDSLTAIVYVLVALIGAVVMGYSIHYLDGDPAHGRFTQWLCLTLAAVLLLIISGHLFQFALAWVATSVGLNRLLLFYPERRAAVLAARKKFVSSRLSDVCLIAAMVLVYHAVGSLDYATIFARITALHGEMRMRLALHLTAALLVCAALLKSAQFPFHGWLTEVMESPTPVSALLHAGIINAGGFLVLRFSDLIALSVPSLELLTIVGAITALFGSVVMLPQTNVKVSLAFSTIAQIGFMMLECGLGAFSAALLHLVAHSLYKAHSFLASGGVIDLARASWSPSPSGTPHRARVGLAIVAVLGIGATTAALWGATIVTQPGVTALGLIVFMGLAHLIANAIDERPNVYVLGRTLGLALAVAMAYFALQWGVERLLQGSLAPVQPLRGPFDLAVIVMVLLFFGMVIFFQNFLRADGHGPVYHALYVHVANGLYLNAFANRMALRYWPRPTVTVDAPSAATERPS